MKKSEKKLSKEEIRELQFLIEGFLETDRSDISKDIEDDAGKAKELWNQLDAILFKEPFFMDEVDQEDFTGVDYEKLILGYHSFLGPIWHQFKSSLFDFRYRVVPERKETKDLKKRIEKDTTSPLSEFKELLDQDSVINWEKFYDIKITVSFDPGYVTFYKRSLNVAKNFVDLLEGVPISYFGRCKHCGKCIIMTRSDKQYCKGCAARKYQDDKWKEDPEGMKQREKERYHSKRKNK